ncbi:MAG: tRNA lysidine(34) synthetase TilS [Oscillospiraceae bacterium]|nr:tRNA lysidine(34) synthetase TilS [Oscillospiraceae bacterium]
MTDKVAAFLRERQIAGRLVCAVSGGADSMALLDCLVSLSQTMPITVSCAHFNHRLRGAASDRDEDFVRRFCAARGIALHLGRCDVAAQCGESVETAARRARYAFFDTLPGDYVVTAHTADDNLETVLMRLLRGPSLKGLCGIPPVRGRFLRPLLGVTRAEILAYLAAASIDHVEDETNALDDCLRNRLRHHVVPLLEQENPSLAASVAARCQTLRDEDALLDTLAGQALEKSRHGGGYRCSVLTAQPDAVQKRAALLLLRQAGVPAHTEQHVRALCALIASSNPSAQCSLPGMTAARQYDLLLVPAAAPLSPPEMPLAVPGRTMFGAAEILCSLSPLSGAIAVALDRVGSLTVRARRPGDAITLSGGTKTLKKLLIDHKIPAARRPEIPVITDACGIVAVGFIGADRNRIPAAGEAALYIKCTERSAKL